MFMERKKSMIVFS